MIRLAPLFLSFLLSLLFAAEKETWLIHYTAEGGGFLTTVDLINSDFSQNHGVTLEAFAADGSLLGDISATLDLEPGARLRLDREALGWAGWPVAHVRARAEEAVRVGALYRADAAGAMSASVAGSGEAMTSARFAPVDATGFFDGLVLVNPSGEAILNVDISAHDAAGNTLLTKRIDINPGAKWLNAVSLLFEGMEDPLGYVQVNGNAPFLAMGLRGTLGNTDQPVLTELALDSFVGIAAPLSYSNQISRIVQRECATCHHDGGIGPFPFTSHDETAPFAAAIDMQVSEGLMPPWKADPNCEQLLEEQIMDAAEKEMLLEWVRQDTPMGDPVRAPEPIAYPGGEWQLGVPDQELVYDEAFTFEAGSDQYQCFPIRLNNSGQVQLEAIEVLPGNKAIVHHVLVFIEDNTIGEDLDAMEDGPGYTCFGGPGTGGFRLIAGWAPGMAPIQMPDDVGMTIEPGAMAIVQVHYSYSFTDGEDQTRVGLHYAEQERRQELVFLPLVNDNFVIPAGAPDHLVEQSFTLFPGLSAEIYFIAPHMHLLGKNISVEASFADGSETCLIDIPRWDFNWQRFYQYPEPIRVGGGTTLTLRARYDNSTDNPNNPSNPPMDVGWGEATTDEMALAFLGLTSPLLSLKDEPGKYTWPLMPNHGVTTPDEVRASLKAKRRVNSCCNDLAAEKAGTTCPSRQP